MGFFQNPPTFASGDFIKRIHILPRTWKIKCFELGYETFKLFAYFSDAVQSVCLPAHTPDLYLLSKPGVFVSGYSQRIVSCMRVE